MIRFSTFETVSIIWFVSFFSTVLWPSLVSNNRWPSECFLYNSSTVQMVDLTFLETSVHLPVVSSVVFRHLIEVSSKT